MLSHCFKAFFNMQKRSVGNQMAKCHLTNPASSSSLMAATPCKHRHDVLLWNFVTSCKGSPGRILLQEYKLAIWPHLILGLSEVDSFIFFVWTFVAGCSHQWHLLLVTALSTMAVQDNRNCSCFFSAQHAVNHMVQLTPD